MNFQTIKPNQVAAVLAAIPATAIFTVEFLKKDKSVRKMNCRTGVTSYLNPNPSRPRPAMPANLVTVFDMQVRNYRQFNLDTTRKIVAEGTTFTVEA